MLTAIYIKGFKTFARPVMMPLEGGITAIVGPNGSGKSNVTDAVLFALGEQSPGVLRAGAMGDLIFSGSESLPAASAAEVSLVFDNASGEISLPYAEVSVTRRISRAGETEYKINGSRSRLADVRAVAGEAGLGRHSILRQGAVDAIVSGGAAACRLALEEAAGLGVYRRRRLSASRRLDRAQDQLEKSRQLEEELGRQLRRIQTEAAAARRYRELESRYRELSLAHLYRVATRELGGLRRRTEKGHARVEELTRTERSLAEAGEEVEERLRRLGTRLGETERFSEALEDAGENLRSENLRSERALLRLEAGRGREGDRRRTAARLREQLERASRGLAELEERGRTAEGERSTRQEAARQGALAAREAAKRRAEAEGVRSKATRELERLRARMAGLDAAAPPRETPEDDRRRISEALDQLVKLRGTEPAGSAERPDDSRALAERLSAEASRRGGALAAAVGRAESRTRSLREVAPAGEGTRLYEVVRARPGYEAAVEAALGEYGAGVLAGDLDEGLRLLSSAEPVAVRLDAPAVEANGSAPGRPLLDCVEVTDGRYAGAVERLLGGIFVIERPQSESPPNGYVAVTRDGLRLTRTTVSLRSEPGNFAREARLAAALKHLEALKNGPGGLLYDLRETVETAGRRLGVASDSARSLRDLAARAGRARATLEAEARRRRAAAETARRRHAEHARLAEELSESISAAEGALEEAETILRARREESDRAAADAEAARAVATETDGRLRKVRAAISEGKKRRSQVAGKLERLDQPELENDDLAELARRTADLATRILAAVRERRAALRQARADLSGAQHRASEERTALSRRAVGVAGELAVARAEAGRFAEAVEKAEAASAASTEEIRTEWGASLEAARAEADKHPEETDAERQKLAGQLKRFGDVNLLALSQERDLRERHEFVSAQRADAETAAADLNRIIRSVDTEIEDRFAETFSRVREAFGGIVPRMLAGSSGVLDLSEEGVEIGLRLGRKGWRPLKVLSGGERALLALSFLFSIFLSRPGRDGGGAFCILDEAEAALDDVNLARFLSVVDSHRTGGQYLLVTHQKRTMAAADVLYGVVQDASGSTTVVSKRLQGE